MDTMLIREPDRDLLVAAALERLRLDPMFNQTVQQLITLGDLELTTGQAANVIGISYEYLMDLIRAGGATPPLPVHWHGQHRYIRLADALTFRAARAAKKAAPTTTTTTTDQVVACDDCGQLMYVASCTSYRVQIGGRVYQRVPFELVGDQRCHDCGVAPGGQHHPGCDMETCPACTGQLIACNCKKKRWWSPVREGWYA